MSSIARRVFAGSSLAALLMPGVAAAAAPCPYVWHSTLKTGSRGADVSALQVLLGVDAAGVFGPKTAVAVRQFQKGHSLQQTGATGPLTRAQLNVMCMTNVSAALPSEVPTVDSDHLAIAAASQPVVSIAPAGALYVPFTRVTLTAGSADVTVRSITVERAGFGHDAMFDYLSLLDEDGSEITYGYLHADHRSKFDRDTFTVPAHTSKTVTIAGNMTADLTEYDGQMPILRVVAIDASSPVSGPLPVSGSAQTANASLVIGTASAILSSYDPGADSSRTIFDSSVRFSGVRVSADSREDLKLTSVSWQQRGTAGASDITNVQTVVNGVSYPTEFDGTYYTSSIPDLIIQKGMSADLYVTADVLPGAANRTIRFNINYPSDIVLYGTTYGFGIAPYAAGNTATDGSSVFLTDDGTTDGNALTPFFQGSVATVSSVSFTIGK